MTEPRQNRVTHQNRVTPLGDLISTTERGLVYGNRGCLHDGAGRIRRRWAVQRWIACRLDFRGRRRVLLQPGHYTELFFLDEATAWAAGHRPCAECRYDDWRRFGDCWSGVLGHDRRAAAIDARLHEERLAPDDRTRLHRADASGLPDGTFVLLDGQPSAIVGERVLRWTPGGYQDPRPRPSGELTVITPPSLVAVLRSGWASELPWLHRTAHQLSRS